MSIFKTVSLPGSSWDKIITALRALGTTEGETYARLIEEQRDGSVKVSVSRSKAVGLKASEGRDLRQVLPDMLGDFLKG